MTDAPEIAERNAFRRPNWVPQVRDGSRILVAGASGGLGRALVAMLAQGSNCTVGAHGDTQEVSTSHPSIVPLRAHLETDANCTDLIERFVGEAGGLDGLVVLTGRLTEAQHWEQLSEEEWRADIHNNLNIPFFLTRAAMRIMKKQAQGGRIVLTGTESALHGGSPQSFPYAIAKRGTETMVQGLAREGAPWAVTVNGIRLGYFRSGFHQRWSNRSAEDMEARARLVPMKRGGEPEEAAALMTYLLSDWSGFISGQMFAATGADWL